MEIFKDACVKHTEATEIGDYKTGNKQYDIIVRAYDDLKSKNVLVQLKQYLLSPFIEVRLRTAYYWLTINESEALTLMKEIEKSSGIILLTAETTISESKKENIKF